MVHGEFLYKDVVNGTFIIQILLYLGIVRIGLECVNGVLHSVDVVLDVLKWF